MGLSVCATDQGCIEWKDRSGGKKVVIEVTVEMEMRITEGEKESSSGSGRFL